MNEEGDGMKRIFFNNLKGRLREYVTVLVCGIFTIAVLFWSNAVGVQIFFILFIVFDEIIACFGTDAILF